MKGKNQPEWKNANDLLNWLNKEYLKLHTTFEDLFWASMMGDHSVNKKKDVASKARNEFRANEKLKAIVNEYHAKSSGVTKERLMHWQLFFSINQVPNFAKPIKEKMEALETKIEEYRASRKQGYIDQKTKKFVTSPVNAMRAFIVTSENEEMRKACFDALNDLAIGNIDNYINLVQLRNEYAKALGYEDFYAYKLKTEEGMTKRELFKIFDTIYDKTEYGFKNVRDLEKTKHGLRKPWNFFHMLAGSFIKEEDPYYPFEESLDRWGRSFAALGINYQGSTLVLDLLEREGKYSNGFCHWPEVIHFEGSKRIPGRAQMTCNVSLDIPGQSAQGLHTLFHEGGHAAHLLNTENKDVCLNTEFPPASTAWDETQSMFLDTLFSSIEWRSRYAKNAAGEAYPFSFYERRVKGLEAIRPLSMMGLMRVCYFEKEIYETKNLTKEKVIAIAKKNSQRFNDYSVDSLSILEVPHIYTWDNACSYHAYGLAELALAQWREYFFDKYGYIVDNPHIGKEMKKVWSYGSAKTFPDLVKIATGKKLSPLPYIRSIIQPTPILLKRAKERIATLNKKAEYKKPIDLKANIFLVSGKKVVTNNKKSFEDMAEKYATWIMKQKTK
jgi:Zn-dependent oligopeptidase